MCNSQNTLITLGKGLVSQKPQVGRDTLDRKADLTDDTLGSFW